MLSNEIKNRVKNSVLDMQLEYLEEVFESLIERVIVKLQNRDNEKKPLLTIDDIARKFKVTKATIHNWKNKGSLVGQKFGKNRYFTEVEVEQSMAKFGYSKQWDNRVTS